MQRALIALVLLASAAFAQPGQRLDYALILTDPPVAERVPSRASLRGAEARSQQDRIRGAQSSVLAELGNRKVRVLGAAQVLVNAVFINATREEALSLRAIPGVARVVAAPPLRMDLDRAVSLANVPAAWSAVGGASNAGAGIKIGILDSGIDQNHPGFQDPTLPIPPGFPKGETAYTNRKVIVARSYVELDSMGYNPNDLVSGSHPDDYSPRDRQGHGTAIAMIAAGVQNTGPQGTIQGVAPKAWLGNYKLIGSPGINDSARFAAFNQALEDALADGMDIVTLSLSEGSPAFYAPLDVDTDGCKGACDIYSQAVENAISKGMVVVTSAGNDGNIGKRIPTLNTIHFPGTAPSAITVGATMNSHVFYQAVRVSEKTGVLSIRAVFGDGPKSPTPLTATVRAAGGDGLACSALPGGSMAGAIALIQRGTCDFTTKIVNAQTAGAVAVILYQLDGQESIYSGIFAQTTGIPAMMIGNSDGAALKTYLAANSNVQATLDPALTPSEDTADVVWPASSRGPSPGTFGATPTTVIKPELVAPGANIYSATQKLDPNAGSYHASGYMSFTGTSYAVPMVAGTVALVKQKYPAMTPAQLKSAVVNTARQSVTDENGAARINSMGAGKLSAGDAVSVTATVEPATIHFGALTSTTVSINRTLRIANVLDAPATFTLRVEQRDAGMLPTVTQTVTVPAGGVSDAIVTLAGNRPNPGMYDGFIVITGTGPTLRVPYQYLVGSGTVADVFPIGNGGFLGGTEDTGWQISGRVIDQFGVPLVGTQLRFNAVSGGGKITAGDAQSFRLGNAAAILTLGPDEGYQIFNLVVGGPGGPTIEFEGFARNYPDIKAISNAASGQGGGLAPGSYISIYGTRLSDAFQLEPTAALPVALSGVSVSFDGGGLSLPGGIHFVSEGQVNTQIPWEFEGQSSVSVKVTLAGLPSYVFTLPLATYSPGLFQNSGVAAVEDAQYNILGANRPAKRGETIQIFANGLGPVTNRPQSREPGSLTVLSETRVRPTVTIGGVNANVSFSGLTPGVVGLYQINAEVPAGVASGAQDMVVTIGGLRSSAAKLYIAP